MNKILNKYISQWKLSQPVKLAETFTSTLYKVDSSYGRAVLKIFTDVGMKDERGGAAFLKNVSEKSAVRLFQSDERAHLLELLSAPNLYEFSKENEEEKASDIFIKIIKDIHSITHIKFREGLLPFEELFKTFDQVNYPHHLDKILKKGKDLTRYLISTQMKEVLLHGDLHHVNVMKTESGRFVCFDPKGILGDPSYELGTILKNPWSYPEISLNIEIFRKRVENFSNELSLPKDRIVGFAYVHLCLSVLWGGRGWKRFFSSGEPIKKN